NTKQLAGAGTSGGAVGLMRSNAKNLTEAKLPATAPERELPFGAPAKVLHGCRQLVPSGVGLSPATSATPIVSYQHVVVGTLARLPTQVVRKVGTTSSHHGPYVQGCTRATMDGSVGSDRASGSRSPTPFPVRRSEEHTSE